MKGCALAGCGRPIENGAAVILGGHDYHPRCVVRLLLVDPRYAEAWMRGARDRNLIPLEAR